MEKPEVMKVITEDAGGVIIATRHEWQRIREDHLSTLNGYAIVRCINTPNGLYQIMKDVDPIRWTASALEAYKLLRYDTDEETGKVILMGVDIGFDEAQTLIMNMGK